MINNKLGHQLQELKIPEEYPPLFTQVNQIQQLSNNYGTTLMNPDDSINPYKPSNASSLLELAIIDTIVNSPFDL